MGRWVKTNFGEWLPDIPAFENPGLTRAEGVLPYAAGYKQFPGAVIHTEALTARCRGTIATRDKSGNTYNYAGDENTLYRLTDVSGSATDTWSNVSRVGASATYSTASSDSWEFARWGEGIVTTNYGDVLQQCDFGTNNFSNLAGSPPRAKHMAVVKGFLVLGNVTDYSSGAALSNRIHWSAFENITLWTPDVSTQCDFQDLQDEGGAVQKVVGGEFGTIWMERSIQRMTYVGPPLIFQVDELERDRGTPAPNSVVTTGTMTFYLGNDDFYMFNRVFSQPIGVNRVYRTFIADLDQDYMHMVIGAVDPVDTLVYWAYPGAGNSGGLPNKIICFNWTANKWAMVELNTEILARYIASDFSMKLACFDQSHKMNLFTGTGVDALFETGDRELAPSRRALVSNIKPIVAGGTVTAQVGTAETIGASATWSSAVSRDAQGECPVLLSVSASVTWSSVEGRYHRVRVNITGGFTHAQGAEAEVDDAGRY